MTSPALAVLAAAEQSRERIRAAEQARLAMLAYCCHPSAWRQAARGTAALLLSARGRLPRSTSATATVCCA